MADESGSTQYNNDSGYSNSGKERENRAQTANPSPREYHDYSVQQEGSAKHQKGTRHNILRSLTTAAVATVAVVTIIPNVLTPSVDVRFEYLNATDSVIEYVLSFENAEENAEISILVVTPNGNTVNEQPAEGEIVSGTVTGLNAGARYDIVVKSGNSTVTSRSVTMAQKRTTAVRSVEHQCRCAVDGTFHFRLDIVDENGYWSGYRATLTDGYGNVSECEFAETPNDEHTLAVNDAGMRGNRATLRITCITTAPDEDGSREEREFVLYESEVDI